MEILHHESRGKREVSRWPQRQHCSRNKVWRAGLLERVDLGQQKPAWLVPTLANGKQWPTRHC